ncbi:MAG: hypothetical protein SGPRY_013751, partial [Prymnesium sp.]
MSSLDALENIQILECLSDRYVQGELLGEGRFSRVYAATPAEERGMASSSIALKEIGLGVLEDDEEAMEMLEAELLALSHASTHPELGERVVKLHEVLKTEECVPPLLARTLHTASHFHIFLVLDRVPGEELFNVIDSQGCLPPQTVKIIMQQLLSSLALLHELGICSCAVRSRRDVKPENLMVSGLEDTSLLRLTLIDFGYADVKCGGSSLERLAGSPEYAAPEWAMRGRAAAWSGARLVRRLAPSPRLREETGLFRNPARHSLAPPQVLSWLTEEGELYDARCDVWSVGITAHVLISGELPFELPEDADEDTIADIAKSAALLFDGEIWSDPAVASARDFVCACLVVDPAQ